MFAQTGKTQQSQGPDTGKGLLTSPQGGQQKPGKPQGTQKNLQKHTGSGVR